MFRKSIIVLLLAVAHQSYAGADQIFNATRTAEAPKIDGVLNDAIWMSSNVATNFTQVSPNVGKPANQNTEVYLIYDNTAVYVGARMHDVSGDSVMTQLGQRDELPNCDWFSVGFDTYNNDQNAFIFAVFATGVQWDAIHNSGWDDQSWNAVWESATTIDENGWTAEFKIPYSALRFPNVDIQDWGVNFNREVRRNREQSAWSFVDPTIEGQVNQWGTMTGVENIDAPIRLSFTPYVSAYLEHYPYSELIAGAEDWSMSYNGGMDVKYGLNEAFTLDMTLIPDFGQARFDQQVLNLSPFEVRFNENRQFFTEGLEMFDLGEVFYSRRVGSRPLDFWGAYADASSTGGEVIENPDISQLINATKVSGRMDNGLGIGIFNGVTKEMHATIEDPDGSTRKYLTDPLTNYNVLVFNQQLKNNSTAILANTNVWRDGSYYDANVTTAFADLYDKDLNWNLYGGGVVSQLYNIDGNDSVSLGHAYLVGLSKVSGQWNYGADFGLETDTYDPNDLGFLPQNNGQYYSGYVRFNMFEPKGKFLNTWSELSIDYNRLYNPDVFTDFTIFANAGGVFRNFMAIGLWGWASPVETYDYFESRVAGRRFTYNEGVGLGGFLSSDYSKVFALDVNWWAGTFFEQGQRDNSISISPRWRASDRLMLILNANRSDNWNSLGAAVSNTTFGGTMLGDTIVFGRRDQVTYNNTLNASFIFTNRMGISLIARHYWSTVTYDKFYMLEEDGGLTDLPSYTGNDVDGNSMHDVGFNAFTIDLVYSWWFAPGSELRIVYKNLINTQDTEFTDDYFRNFGDMIQADQLNSFSIKLLYFVDYLYFRKK